MYVYIYASYDICVYVYLICHIYLICSHIYSNVYCIVYILYTMMIYIHISYI